MDQNKEYKLYIGSHVSLKANDYFYGSIKEALSYNANALMIYTGAPQNTKRIPIDNFKLELANELIKQNNIIRENIIVHAPYIINLCSINKSTRLLAIDFLKQEIIRVEQLGLKYLVLHPGSSTGQDEKIAIQQIIDGLNLVLNHLNTNVVICLETMAGKGSEININLNQTKQIIDGIVKKQNIGICIDTCHISDAGYDIINFDSYLDELESLIGLEYVKLLHINDSKNPVGARKDRHENIGYGHIGFEKLLKVIYHPKLNNLPKILETPYVMIDNKSIPIYKFEIDMIRNKKWYDIKNILINKG